VRERLAAEEVARVAAEASAAKSAVAAEAAADALEVKEQQMAAWKDLEQASKATASQQMQLTQVLAQQVTCSPRGMTTPNTCVCCGRYRSTVHVRAVVKIVGSPLTRPMYCLLQVQLDSMHQRATATEAKLLDQITSLQQQLDKERSAR
jgi:hypothetical protein